MKATIDKEICIGCNLCSDICPKVFVMEDDGLAGVIETATVDDYKCAQDAADNCPTGAITIKSEDN